uniref:Cytochrome P450 n=1 Tax=Kalanchoe fedtschenkoi TaxID=63787 RepID=A0A7N0V1V0_KALFE
MPLCMAFLVFVFLSSFFLLIFKKNNKHYNLPPSPFRLPIIGNFHQIGLFPHRQLASLARRHGSLMLLRLGSVPTLVVSSAKSAAEVFKTHDVAFSSRPGLAIFHALLYDCAGLVAAPYGECWRQLRSLVVIHVLSSKRVRGFRSIREEETMVLMEEIEKTHGCPFDLSELLASLNSDIICRVAFGRKYRVGEGGNTVNIKKVLEELSCLAGAFNIADFIPWLSWMSHINGLNFRIKQLAQKIDSIFQAIVDDHIRKGRSKDGEAHKDDVVDVMLELQENHNKSGDGMPISMDNIKGVILDLFVGGTETSTTTLDWAMAELIKHPEIMEKAQQEVRDIIGRGDHVTEDDVAQMNYLKAVLKETFRMHPAGPVLVNVWAIGRDESSWERPDEFDPERFLKGGGAGARDFKGQDFELIPFGAGRRGCPGISLSSCVLELVLANLLHRFDWSLPGGGKLEELDMSETFGSTVRRKYPLMVVAAAAAAGANLRKE